MARAIFLLFAFHFSFFLLPLHPQTSRSLAAPQQRTRSLPSVCTNFAPANANVCCRDGGMVDTRDLKSLGHNGCAGSSPARGTAKRMLPVLGSILFIVPLHSCGVRQLTPIVTPTDDDCQTTCTTCTTFLQDNELRRIERIITNCTN